MFDQVAGLPAHPLLVHAAVVLAPTLALVAVGYVLLPALRVHSEKLLLVLAVTAPLSVAVARESGAAFQRRLIQEQGVAPGLLDQIDTHAASARTLLLLTLALSGAAFARIVLNQRGRSTAPTAVLAVITCTLGVAVLWSVVNTGHTGSAMVWS